MKKILAIILSGLALIAGLILIAPAQAVAPDKPPDLRTRTLTDFRIENASNGEKRLRFKTRIANAGPGRFEVRMDRPNTSTAEMTVIQKVYRTDGTWRWITGLKTHGFYNAGDGHDHWHVYKLQDFGIYKINADGSTGTRAGSGAKTGFCFLDNSTYNLTFPGAPQSPYYKGCGTKASTSVKAGISVGWADTYAASIAKQWIKINNLQDGKYRVIVKTDPSNWFKEVSETNNWTHSDIRITGSTVTVLYP